MKLILSCLTLIPTPTMVKTGTKTPKEMDKANKILPAEARAIAVKNTETQRLQNIHLKEK